MDCLKLNRRTAIMRPFLAFLVFLIAFFSCSDEEPLLSPNLVTDLRAYDLDNNGDASDIRVDFVVANNLNVTEYRIMILPTTDTWLGRGLQNLGHRFESGPRLKDVEYIYSIVENHVLWAWSEIFGYASLLFSGVLECWNIGFKRKYN